jgi:hypothetical protein
MVKIGFPSFDLSFQIVVMFNQPLGFRRVLGKDTIVDLRL